jgi:hypothetical protein
MALNKEQILGAQDMKTETVEVPEWGGAVLVKTMTGTERDAFEFSLVAGQDAEKRKVSHVRARLVAYTLVDEAGALLFSEADIAALGAKSAAALDRVYDVAARLNGVGQKDLEALAKN